MVAYVISEVEILDEELGQQYRKLAAESIARYGGRYLARGAEAEVAEGEFPAERRVVIVEFPDIAQARRWYDSPEYAQTRQVRVSALDRRLIFVDGVPG